MFENYTTREQFANACLISLCKSLSKELYVCLFCLLFLFYNEIEISTNMFFNHPNFDLNITDKIHRAVQHNVKLLNDYAGKIFWAQKSEVEFFFSKSQKLSQN